MLIPSPPLADIFPITDGWIEQIDPVGELSGPVFGSAFRKRAILDPRLGEGFRDFSFIGDSVAILRSAFQHKEDACGVIDGSDLLKFHFSLDGANRIDWRGETQQVVRGGTAALALHPKGVVKQDGYTGGVKENSLTFACRPHVLTELLQLEPEGLPEGLRDCLSGGPATFFCRDVPLTSRMVQTMNEMFAPRYSPAVRHMHAQARMLDLMCLLIDALIANRNEPRSGLVLRSRDIEALHRGRDLLLERIEDPPHVDALARELGLNRTKLAQGFKHVFGETVFDFSQRIRLEKALTLLQDTDLSVCDIAMAVGYRHQSSFAVAFKAHFGISPNTMRRK